MPVTRQMHATNPSLQINCQACIYYEEKCWQASSTEEGVSHTHAHRAGEQYLNESQTKQLHTP